MKSVPSFGERGLTAAAAKAGAKWPINIRLTGELESDPGGNRRRGSGYKCSPQDIRDADVCRPKLEHSLACQVKSGVANRAEYRAIEQRSRHLPAFKPGLDREPAHSGEVNEIECSRRCNTEVFRHDLANHVLILIRARPSEPYSIHNAEYDGGGDVGYHPLCHSRLPFYCIAA